MPKINNDWDPLLEEEFKQGYYQNLRQFLKQEYSTKIIYPPMHDIFNALKLTPYGDVKAVIVGQDPYINHGQAHGLSFSVNPGEKIPPSLGNIYKELSVDMGCTIPNNGNLLHWAAQGVLLLNTVLTVEAKKSRSHAGQGWERFTDYIMELLNRRNKPMVFLLWGRDAHAKGRLIDNTSHLILQAAHPSPLAGGRFFGNRHFSKTNEFLLANGMTAIDWQLPDVGVE